MIKLSLTAWQAPYAVLAMGMALHMPAQCATTTSYKKDSLMLAAQTTAATPAATIDSLELVGVGIFVETWRNHPDYPKFNLWNAINEANGNYIISQDLRAYPKSFEEWKMVYSKRANDAVDAAMREFMDRYPLPIAIVGPSWGEPDDPVVREQSRKSNAGSFVKTKSSGTYTDRGEFSGLLTQSGQVMNSYLNDEPDLLWQTIFSTFDQHWDIPSVGIAAKDSAMHRALSLYHVDYPRYEALAAQQVFRPKQAKIISESATFIVLVRRDRIERLRSYGPLVVDTMRIHTFDNRGGEPSRNRSEFAGWKSQPAQPFVATPYLPEPWTPFQIDQFDHLENFGTLHRPQVVSYVDEQGKPLKAAERLARFELALRAALAPLGGKLPTRIFYDYGSVWDDRTSATRFLPLVKSLHALAPEFDLLDTRHGYDLSRILGDTGAGSPFVGVAVATMAGKQSGGASLVVNLRRDDGATMLLVTPPSAEQLAKDAAVKRPYWPRKEKPANAFKALFQRSGE